MKNLIVKWSSFLVIISLFALAGCNSSGSSTTTTEDTDNNQNNATLPSSVAGQSVTMVYSSAQTGSFYSNGDVVLFTFSSSGTLTLTNQYTVVSDSVSLRGNEYIWVDDTSSVEYALSLDSSGNIHEVNIYGIGGSPFYGQFTIQSSSTSGTSGSTITAPTGAIDTTFGTSGMMRNSNFEIRKLDGVTPTINNKLYLFAGLADGTKQVSRIDYSGQLDTSFNTDGHSASFSVGDNISSFTVDGQGRVYYVERVANVNLVITRLDTSGALDTTWGTNGELTISSLTLTGASSWIYSFAAQGTSDGGLYVGGQLYGNPYKWIVFKLDANGALDTSFNTTGIWQDTFTHNTTGSGLRLMHLAANGDLYVGGEKDSADVVVTRFSGGSQDTNYGSSGYATFNTGAKISRIATDSSGRVIGVGSMTSSINGHGDAIYVGRLTSTGSMDSSFGTSGVVEVNFYDKTNTGTRNNYATDLLVQSDDSVVVSGHLNNTISSEPDWIVLTRLDSNGALSSGFGMNDNVDTNGTILIESSGPGTFSIKGNSGDTRRTAMIQTASDGLLGFGITDESVSVANRVTLFAWK